MYIFKSELSGGCLATNPKVLTQTLSNQNFLKRYLSKKRYLHFFLKELNKSFGPDYIFLVRNPYTRVESFFKEKLRQKVKLVGDKENPYKLKKHQKIFYPSIGIKAEMPQGEIVKKLLSFSFEQYIKTLPYVYKMDDHLTPQLLNYTRKVLSIKWEMKFNRIIHVEDQNEMIQLAGLLHLNINERRNKSEDINNEVEWSKESISLVRKLYQDDFKKLGYSYNIDERYQG